MTRADKPEHRHPGSAPGDDSRDAVLDHQAVFRLDAHRSRRVQKKIRTWFSLRDVGSGKNVGSEHGLVASGSKREAQPLMPARGGDAYTGAQAFDSLPHAFDPFQFARKRRENLAREIVAKTLGQRRPEFGLDSTHGRIEPTPQEALARLLIGQAKASLPQPAAHDAKRDHFAVDEHAITIKNDHFRPARLAIEFANLPLSSAQHLAGLALSRVEGCDRSACWRRGALCERRHRRHRGGHRLRPGRNGAHHRRAEKHRLRGLRRHHRLAAYIGDDLADQRAAGRAATDDNRIEFITRLFELTHDIG